MCHRRNIAVHDYQKNVTTGQTDRQTPNKVIPMCSYALQATQQYMYVLHKHKVIEMHMVFQTGGVGGGV